MGRVESTPTRSPGLYLPTHISDLKIPPLDPWLCRKAPLSPDEEWAEPWLKPWSLTKGPSSLTESST